MVCPTATARAMAFAALFLSVVAALGLCASAAVPESPICFFGGYPNPNGYAYVSYLQPRFTHVKFNPIVIGLQNSSVSYEGRRDRLRSDILKYKCDAVVDNGGNSANYTLYRELRAEPGMPLWIESKWGKSYYNTVDEADKYPALRMWPLDEDQSVTAINTALALNWKDVVIVSTNKTGDNVTLATVSAQAQREGLRVHKTFVEGDEGMETTEKLIDAIAAQTPTRAILSATSRTNVIQALVDSPKGLVPIVPLDMRSDYVIRASLGVLGPQALVLTPPANWEDHWKNNTFTNHTHLWELWQVTQPRSGDQYYFRNTTGVYMNDVEALMAALAVVDAYYNKTSPASASSSVAPPTARQLLDASRGLEIELFTSIVRMANHSAGTYAPPRALEVVLTQPPRSSLYYTWTVIANVSTTGETWQTTDVLHWPAIGKMSGIVDPLFPIPVVPEEKTNWALYGVLAALGFLLIVAGIVALVYFVSRWAKLRHCPKNAEEPFTAFFVSTHNEDEIRDLYGYKAHDVFMQVRSIVVSAAADHKCYIARRLEAHYLIVGNNSVDAVRCAAQVVTEVSNLTARKPPVAKKKIRVGRAGSGAGSSRAGSLAPSTRSSGTKTAVYSDTRSEMSARSRALTSGFAASQARKVGVTPHIAVGMARAVGRIEFEDGAYTYGGEPVDIAAAVADFAIHNQILATAEVLQGLQETPTAQSFDEYCERELGRGHCADNYELLEYSGEGCPRADPELAEAAREGKSSGGGGVGALSAALQASNGGLVTRSVAVAAIHVPELGSRCTDAAAIARIQDAFDIVSEAAEEFKGTFAALHDGWCVLTVNGTGGVAQAPMRATSVAVSAVDTLRECGFAACAGVSAGPMVAGGAAGEATAGRHITAGGHTERARVLALGACLNDTAVLVTETVKREAESSFDFAASDFIAARAPAATLATNTTAGGRLHPKGMDGKAVDGKKLSKDKSAGLMMHEESASSEPSFQPSPKHASISSVTNDVEEVAFAIPAALSPASLPQPPQLSQPSQPAHKFDDVSAVKKAQSSTKASDAFRTVKVFSVIAASTAGEVNDEWMYQLAAAGSGPCVRINAAFELIGEGAMIEAQSKLTEASSVMQLMDSPEMAAVDGEGHAAMKAAVARGEALCSALGGHGEDHGEALTSAAVKRTNDFMCQAL